MFMEIQTWSNNSFYVEKKISLSLCVRVYRNHSFLFSFPFSVRTKVSKTRGVWVTRVGVGTRFRDFKWKYNNSGKHEQVNTTETFGIGNQSES